MKKGDKVICINPPTLQEIRQHECKPLAFAETYVIEEIVDGARGRGYVLQGVDNSHIQVVRCGKPLPHVKFSYHESRFMPLQTFEEPALNESTNAINI